MSSETGTLSRRVVLAGAVALGAQPALAAERPRRIVSLASCLDYILVEVADRSQIAALSRFARDEQSSPIAAVARTLPFTWGSAEEVIALNPDLVLSTRMGGATVHSALRHLDIRTEQFSVPSSIAPNIEQVREVASQVGWPERGERLVARMQAALAAARAPAGMRPIRTLVYQSNGFSPGPNTLVGETMRIVGFENMAARYGLKTWGTVPLERVLADPPELLLVGDSRPGRVRNWGDRVTTHPALKALGGRMRQGHLPESLVYCGGPVLIRLAEAMTRARTEYLRAAA